MHTVKGVIVKNTKHANKHYLYCLKVEIMFFFEVLLQIMYYF